MTQLHAPEMQDSKSTTGTALQRETPAYLDFLKESYTIDDVIGSGTFSIVYSARCRATGQRVALKCITKTSAPDRVLDELAILRRLDGHKNCVRLLRVLRSEDLIAAVFPLVSSTDFKDFVTQCSMRDIRCYMSALLKALVHTHGHSIIHRDLKPSNFMYSIEAETGLLIDFGLAQNERPAPRSASRPAPQPVVFFNTVVVPSRPPGYYERDTRPPLRAPRAGTRGFRAPEVLFRYEAQTKAIDLWSAGVILLCILTAQYPFFLSAEDTDNLVEIALIFGHAEMRRAAKLYGRVWKSNLSTIKEERIPFAALVKRLNPLGDANPAALDLLDRLLDLNCFTRITAAEALDHPFFRSDSLRQAGSK